MAVLTATAMLPVMLAAVSVTTAWIPPTSFERRLWISPVRVSVKNRRGIRWRCAYSALRRSCMTFWPTTLFTYAWPTPMRPLMIGTTIMRPTKRFRSSQSSCGIAVSMSALSRSGLMSPRRLVTMIATRTMKTWRL